MNGDTLTPGSDSLMYRLETMLERLVPRLMPRRRTWTEPFDKEFARATKGLIAGFMVASALICGVVMIDNSATMRDGMTIDSLMHALVMITIPLTVVGCMVAVVPLTIVMMLERVIKIDLGAPVWIAIGILPSLAVSAAALGGHSTIIGPAICMGGYAATFAYVLRSTTGRKVTAAKWALTAATCLTMLVAACIIGSMLPGVPRGIN